MITSADIRRWTQEAAPALRGGFVHRIWRDEGDAWVLLVRKHEGGDASARAVSRAALELATPADWARVVALPPDQVAADDDKAKKSQARDSHPFLSLLRRTLVGARVDDVAVVPGERIVAADFTQTEPSPSPDAQPRTRLIVELISRQGNLILGARDEGDNVRVLGALHPGKAPRTFERGTLYAPPPPRVRREGAAAPDERPQLCPEVEPDPERLTLGKAVAAALREKAEAAAASSRHATYARAARQAIKRAEGVVHKLELQVADVARADELERQADLLKANLGSIARGAKEARLVDYSKGEPATEVVIALDPAEPVHDQMEALYKKARKLRSGEAAVQQRLGEVDRSIDELRALEQKVEATDPDDEAALDALEKALRKLGALPKETAGPKARVQVNQGPRSFRTKEGHEVLVGRSDEENDRLTMRMARGNDLFFHVRGCPGSHVILRVDEKRPPNHESLMDAAAVAVHYSKARSRGSAVDVSYTPRKWVKKPRGAKPGLVQISNEKTIRAGNDPERLKRVLSTSRREDGDGEEDA